MSTYDEAVLQQLADGLYRRATFVFVVWILVSSGLGVLLVVGGGLALSFTIQQFGEQFVVQVLGPRWAMVTFLLGWLLFALFALVGVARGSAAAFELKVRAQQILWMLKIENRLREIWLRKD